LDPIKNPFSPGAGAPPPEMVGRASLLRQAEILFGRTLAGRSEKSIIMTGLRGVGKTVLLNEIRKIAEAAGFETISVEASDSGSLADAIAPGLRQVLFQLDSSERVRRALRVLKGWAERLQITVEGEKFTLGLGGEPEPGVGDSGNYEADLRDLFRAVAESAQDRGKGVALLIDEIQYLNQTELGALIVAMHHLQQRQLPFVLVGAGLPTLPALAGNAKSYAERLFSYPIIDALSRSESDLALEEPVKTLGATFHSEALKQIFDQTEGYPYFLQEWGYHSWNISDGPLITGEDVRSATNRVVQRLDESFFRVRFDRLTPSEKRFLRFMAELGKDGCKTGELAEAMGQRITNLGPTRAKLLQKGMIFTPAHGDLRFTVPRFADFMKRTMPENPLQPS
jgi:hypothetical protein